MYINCVHSQFESTAKFVKFEGMNTRSGLYCSREGQRSIEEGS